MLNQQNHGHKMLQSNAKCTRRRRIGPRSAVVILIACLWLTQSAANCHQQTSAGLDLEDTNEPPAERFTYSIVDQDASSTGHWPGGYDTNKWQLGDGSLRSLKFVTLGGNGKIAEIPHGRGNQSINPIFTHKRALIGNRDMEPQQQLFTYVVSPLSRQILPFRSDKLAQGFRKFFTLATANHNYKIGLQKTNENTLATMPFQSSSSSSLLVDSNGCQTVRGLVELTREDTIDIELAQREGLVGQLQQEQQLTQEAGNILLKSSKQQLIRNCRGLVQLNRCDGFCISNVQPSVKTRGGFKRECSCCNEGSFKRVTVRLNECFLPSENNKRINSDDNGLAPNRMSFMDIEVEEPIDCRCRQCDNST